MDKKILFVSSADKTATLYYYGVIFSSENYIDESLLYRHLKNADYSEIVVYDWQEDAKVVTLAQSFQFPVLAITDMLEEYYYTDILSVDIENIHNSAIYMGIFDKMANSLLMAEIYRRVKSNEQNQLELFTEDKTFTLRNDYGRRTN